jgi:hypothetical protein
MSKSATLVPGLLSPHSLVKIKVIFAFVSSDIEYINCGLFKVGSYM